MAEILRLSGPQTLASPQTKQVSPEPLPFPIFTSNQTPKSKLLEMSTSELACSYAALILADEEIDITVRSTIMSWRTAVARSTINYTPSILTRRIHSTGRQTQHHHQSRKSRGSRAHMDVAVRQGMGTAFARSRGWRLRRWNRHLTARM